MFSLEFMGWPENSRLVNECYNTFSLLESDRVHRLARGFRVGQRGLYHVFFSRKWYSFRFGQKTPGWPKSVITYFLF